MKQITATLLWVDGQLFRCAVPSMVNCATIGGAKIAYLIPPNRESGQNEYTLSFGNPKNDPNALQGVYILEDGIPKIIDTATVQNLVDACAECCDTSTPVPPKYNGVFPAHVDPLAKTYTVTRANTGSYLDDEKFQIDYLNFIIPSSWRKTSADGTTSVYVFNSYKDPTMVGTDTVVETARIFQSAVAPTLSGSNVFNATVTVDGVVVHKKGTTTLSALPGLLAADAIAGPMGTWSIVSSKLQLSTTVHDYATLVLDQEAP